VQHVGDISVDEQLALFDLANSIGSEPLEGSGFEDETPAAEEEHQ
jgi:hypothetical protein